MRSAGLIALFACVLTTQVLGSPTRTGSHKNDIRTYYQKVGKTENESLSNTCTECKFVASELKNVISDPAKLGKLKLVLKLMCDYLGGSEVQECKNIIDNLDFFIHQLEPFLDDPEEFCQKLHLCSSRKIPFYSHAVLHFFKFMIRTANATRSNDILCDECVFASTELKNLLKNVEVQQQLKKELEQICQIMSSLQHQCNEFVEEYFPFVLKVLQQLLSSPKHFCSEVQMCLKNRPKIGSSMERAHRLRIAVFEVPVVKVNFKNKLASSLSMIEAARKEKVKKAVCIVCQHRVKSFQQLLKDKKRFISSKFNTVICNMLPEDLAIDCADFAGSYVSSVVLMAIDAWTPQQICLNAGMCTNKTINASPQVDSYGNSPVVCDACRTVTDFVSFELGKEALQKQIIDMIKQDLCPLLPGDLSSQCLDEAEPYVRKLATWIADYVKNPDFCKAAGLCHENLQMIPQ